MSSTKLSADPTYKKPGELLKLKIDFALFGLAPSGETISSVSIAAVSGLTIGTPTVNTVAFVNRKGGTCAIGKGVQVDVSSGTAGEEYHMDVSATTTTGQILIGRCPIHVRDG